MDFLNFLGEWLSQYGFPIVACVALFWKMNDQDTKHKDEVQKLTEALNNNTTVMQKLSDKLDGV